MFYLSFPVTNKNTLLDGTRAYVSMYILSPAPGSSVRERVFQLVCTQPLQDQYHDWYPIDILCFYVECCYRLALDFFQGLYGS